MANPITKNNIKLLKVTCELYCQPEYKEMQFVRLRELAMVTKEACDRLLENETLWIVGSEDTLDFDAIHKRLTAVGSILADIREND